MLALPVTSPVGAGTVVEAQEGVSVMERLSDAGFESLPAF